MDSTAIVMRKVGYARVSSKGQNLEMQRDALKAAGCETIFEEKMSGARDDRPELARCLATLNEGDVLVVYSLSRLGRSTAHLLFTVDDLRKRGIGFQSLHENIETLSPTGKLVFTVLAALAEFERDILKERQRDGIDAALARGKKWGPKSIITAELARNIREDIERGIPKAEIARSRRIGRATLYRWLDAEQAS